MELDPEEGTLCDTSNAGMGATIGIELGPISEKKLNEEYIMTNGVRSMFQDLIAGLMVQRPSDYVSYIESKVKQLKLERDLAKRHLPIIPFDQGPDNCKAEEKIGTGEAKPTVTYKAGGFKFADPLHPTMSPIKKQLYIYCPDDHVEERSRPEEETFDHLHPVDVHDLASKIIIERGLGPFDEKPLEEKVELDITKINPAFSFDIPTDKKFS